MSEQQRNGYEDDDLKAVVQNIEQLEDEIKSIMASAMNDAKQKRSKIKDIRLEAKGLNIPLRSLSVLLQTRKLQRKIEKVAGDVPDDQAEIFEDMIGQFSFLPPEKEGETVAQSAAKRRKKKAQADDAKEQAEGEEVLKDLVH